MKGENEEGENGRGVRSGEREHKGGGGLRKYEGGVGGREKVYTCTSFEATSRALFRCSLTV